MSLKKAIKNKLWIAKNFGLAAFSRRKDLILKIRKSKLVKDPFPHLLVENFFPPAVFDALTNLDEVKITGNQDIDLIENLIASGWAPIIFPGCTTEVQEYLDYRNTGRINGNRPDICEGFGMAFRLGDNQCSIVDEINAFLKSDEFAKELASKLEISLQNDMNLDAGFQKYLDGYEISPHPDIRKKLATFMININTDPASERRHHHTELLEFDFAYKKVLDFWNENPLSDRTWVPWHWCRSKFSHFQNNSLIAFAPSNETLHAVKADYPHFDHQRTQFYGNLWQKESSCIENPDYVELASRLSIDIDH